MFDVIKLIGVIENSILDIDTMRDFIINNDIHVGVVCVPKNKAQEVTDAMVECGIKSIWNFAPIDVGPPDNVAVENVHLSDSLYTLAYKMNEI